MYYSNRPEWIRMMKYAIFSKCEFLQYTQSCQGILRGKHMVQYSAVIDIMSSEIDFSLKVLHVAPECAPLAKKGGLGVCYRVFAKSIEKIWH